MAKWLDKYEQGGLVLKKKTKDNYGKKPNVNDVQASVGPDFVGLGYNTKGRDYSPAWGGQFQDGGKLTLPEAIVYGHKDPKVKDYFDKVRTDAEKWRDEYYWNTPTAGYHALEQMHNKYGAPKINTIGEKDRAYYNPITDSMNISIPKYGDEYGDPVEDQFLHELAHKVQANKKGNVGFVKDFVGKDLINTLKNVDSSDIFTKKGWLDAYRKNYHTPGTVENEAHSVIAPKLEEEYRDIRSKQYDRLYGDMAMGGALPGAVGFTYARTQNPAPSNGKYAKKTKASAQNGTDIKLGNTPVSSFIENILIDKNDKTEIQKQQDFVDNWYKNRKIFKDDGAVDTIKYPKISSDTKPIYTVKTDLGAYGKYDPTANEIKLNRLEDFAELGVPTHEYNHFYQSNPNIGFFPKKNKNRKIGDKYVLDPWEKGLRNNIDNITPEDMKYYLSPDEVQSRLMEIRYLNNLKPDQKVKPSDINNLKIPKESEYLKEKLKSKDHGLDWFLNNIVKNNQQQESTQAQNGTEMAFYQNGLDFTPKSISKNGSVIKDDRGQWAHPGEITEIGSNDITMQGVDYPVLGVSDTGDTQMMYPDQDYKFDGDKVTEFPMAQNGDWLSKYDNISSGNNLKKEAEETIARRNANRPTMSQYTPKKGEQVKFDKQKLQRIAEDNAPLNRMAASKGAENMQDAIEAAMIMEGGLAAGKLVAKGIPKATRAGLNAIDRNFSNVGKELVRIEKEGIKKGLSPEAIKAIQLEEVGITANQREAYVPGVSDALQKYVYPQGYTGAGESKLAQTVKAIKTGTREKSMPTREDAWNLYLGKPQTFNTFRMAETAPVNHPAYTPKQLSKMDIYSINDKFLYNDDVYSNLEGIGPRAIDETTIGDPKSIVSRLEKNSQMVTNPISYDYHLPVMGGYNKRLNQYGLEYNDVWDLEPQLFGKKIKIDNFIGKPFMSHEVLPNITPENVKSLVTSQIKSADAQFKPMVNWYKDLMDKGSMIDYSQTLEGYKSALNKVNELKGKLGMDQDIMTNSKGWGTKDWNNQINTKGWLNKYK